MPTPTPPPVIPITGPVTIFNARIADLAAGAVTEQIAFNTLFNYNPLTEAASFAFTSRQYLYINGEPQQIAGTSAQVLQQDASEIETSFFGKGLADPVTKQDLSNVSVAGILIYIKNAFDILYNKKAAANSTPNPNQPYPSELAIMQANTLYDDFGNGSGGFPLGRAFGGQGTTDGAPSPTPPPTPPNPLTM